MLESAKYLQASDNCRSDFLNYCKQYAHKLEKPSFRDPKLGILARYFDTAASKDIILFPDRIARHLNALDLAISRNTLELWFYTLAQHVKTWLLSEPYLYEDLKEVLGEKNISQIKIIIKHSKISEFEVENKLCQGFLSYLFQMCGLHEKDRWVLTKVQKMLHELYFPNSYIQTKRKCALLKQFKLNIHKEKHLKFWQNQTDLALFNLGGKSIKFLGKNYKVPYRVGKIMKDCPITENETYGSFLIKFNQLRNQSAHPASKLFRKDLTDKFYELDNDFIELYSVKYLNNFKL